MSISCAAESHLDAAVMACYTEAARRPRTKEVRNAKRLQSLRQRYAHPARGRYTRKVPLCPGPRVSARPGESQSAPQEALDWHGVRAALPEELPPPQQFYRRLGSGRPAHAG